MLLLSPLSPSASASCKRRATSTGCQNAILGHIRFHVKPCNFQSPSFRPCGDEPLAVIVSRCQGACVKADNAASEQLGLFMPPLFEYLVKHWVPRHSCLCTIGIHYYMPKIITSCQLSCQSPDLVIHLSTTHHRFFFCRSAFPAAGKSLFQGRHSMKHNWN